MAVAMAIGYTATDYFPTQSSRSAQPAVNVLAINLKQIPRGLNPVFPAVWSSRRQIRDWTGFEQADRH
jgi:hypothetical protein